MLYYPPCLSLANSLFLVRIRTQSWPELSFFFPAEVRTGAAKIDKFAREFCIAAFAVKTARSPALSPFSASS